LDAAQSGAVLAAVRKLMIAQRREHSRKPDEFFDRVSELAAGPYVELFSRQNRPGWDVWGLDAGQFDVPAMSETEGT
jgi:N6-adenosine-specific RNA methylase IME4